MPEMSERASLWGIRRDRKNKKGWTDYIADPSEAVGTSLEAGTPGPPPPPKPAPPPPPPGLTPPPIPPLPKREKKVVEESQNDDAASPKVESIPMDIDWEALINERISRGKPNPVLPDLAPPPPHVPTPPKPTQFIEPPAGKVQRKKKDSANFDMKMYLQAGPPVPSMPLWADEHRRFLLERQMRQKFEPPFTLFPVREDQGSQNQPWPVPWEDSDRNISDSEQDEAAMQERKARRRAKRKAKRAEKKYQEQKRQREELLKQSDTGELEEAGELNEDGVAESRDSDEEADRKQLDELMQGGGYDSYEDDDDESLGDEGDTSEDEDSDEADMATELSQHSSWLKKRLSQFEVDSEEEPQTELEKRLVRGDLFHVHDGTDAEPVKIFVDLKHQCLRFDGSVDDGVSLLTPGFQLKRGICALNRNNELQPSTKTPPPNAQPANCMTLATGRETGILEAPNCEQIDAWVEGIYLLRQKFLDEALRVATRPESSEDDETSEDIEIEQSLDIGMQSSTNQEAENKGSTPEEEGNEGEGSEEEELPEAVIHLPLSPKRKTKKRSTKRKPALEEKQHSQMILLPEACDASIASQPTPTDNSVSKPDTNTSATECTSSESADTAVQARSTDPAKELTEASNTEAKPIIVEGEEPPTTKTNARAGRTRRAAVLVKPPVPIIRHEVPASKEVAAAENPISKSTESVEIEPQRSISATLSPASPPLNTLPLCPLPQETDEAYSPQEKEAARQMRELEAMIELDMSKPFGGPAPEAAVGDKADIEAEPPAIANPVVIHAAAISPPKDQEPTAESEQPPDGDDAVRIIIAQALSDFSPELKEQSTQQPGDGARHTESKARELEGEEDNATHRLLGENPSSPPPPPTEVIALDVTAASSTEPSKSVSPRWRGGATEPLLLETQAPAVSVEARKTSCADCVLL